MLHKINKKRIIKAAWMLAIAFLCFVPRIVLAATAPSTPADIFREIIVPVFTWVGAVMMIFGAIQLGFAFKDEDADSKRKGMLLTMSGAAMIAVCKGFDYIVRLNGDEAKAPKPNEAGGLEGIAGDIGQWVPWMGYCILFWGAIQMVNAMKNDDAAAKQKALTIMFSGVALAFIINLMNWILYGTWN